MLGSQLTGLAFKIYEKDENMKQSCLSHYHSLMQIRLRVFFYMPLALLVLTVFLIKTGLHIVIVTTLVVGCIYFSIFYFLSKNICPWCKGSFFSFGQLGDKTLGNVLFAKKCQHCGRPNSDDF